METPQVLEQSIEAEPPEVPEHLGEPDPPDFPSQPQKQPLRPESLGSRSPQLSGSHFPEWSEFYHTRVIRGLLSRVIRGPLLLCLCGGQGQWTTSFPWVSRAMTHLLPMSLRGSWRKPLTHKTPPVDSSSEASVSSSSSAVAPSFGPFLASAAPSISYSLSSDLILHG